MSEETVVLPEAGELVMITVTRITPYGAYVKLDEYHEVEGLLHISEITLRWVKNIRDHVREGQKKVLKVLRVNANRFHVDLSLRRVSDRERKEKLLRSKQENRGRQLLGLAAEKMHITPEEAYERIGKLIEENFENIYLGLEKTVQNGDSVLTKCGISSDWARVLTEIARSKIKIPQVKIGGILELTSTKPDGVIILKKTFAKVIKSKRSKGNDIRIYTTGAPRYRIEVTAENYKEAEKILEQAINTALKTIKAEKGEGKFTRGLIKGT